MSDVVLFQASGWRVTQHALAGSIFYIKPARLLSTTDCRQWAELAPSVTLVDYILFTWPVRVALRAEGIESFIRAFAFALHHFHPQPDGSPPAPYSDSVAFARAIQESYRQRLAVVGEIVEEWGGFGGLGKSFGAEVDRRVAELRTLEAPNTA